MHKRPKNISIPELKKRLLSHFVGLPKICAVRTCRRHKACLGRDLVCFDHHRGLVDARCEHCKEDAIT